MVGFREHIHFKLSSKHATNQEKIPLKYRMFLVLGLVKYKKAT